MNKLKNMCESRFLKLLFAFVSLCFIVAAFIMPDRADAFTGLWKILSNPTKLSTNFFSVGGFAATFLNMGLVGLAMTFLFTVTRTVVNNVSSLAFFLTIGFTTWGINILNMWFVIPGVVIANLIKKEKPFANVNAMFFATGAAPIVSEMLLRYPHAEVVGFNVLGFVLAVVVGAVVGFLVLSGIPHSPNVHKGMNLLSAGLPVGMTAFFLNGVLYKAVGLEVPGAVGDVAVANPMAVNIFCLVLFALFVILGLLLGCTPKDYWQILKSRNQVANLSGTRGTGAYLVNLGMTGLFILGYYNAIGANLNGVVFGLIFCVISCTNSGSRPSNIWPIMLGYVAASFGFGALSGVLGGTFALKINAAAVCVGLCYATGLTPICDKYGWLYGFFAAVTHFCIVTLVPSLHGGFCLYNGGFTGVLVCIILVPVFEKFCKTKEERQLAKAK